MVGDVIALLGNQLVAVSEPIENKGEMTLNLTTTTGHPIKSKFQVCEVS